MSVCVVAQFPWKAVTMLVGSEPPGLIMCSDTRVVEGENWKPFDFLLTKQYGLSRNLIVCYASSNVDATLRAVLRCAGTSNVRRLGSLLREGHKKWGGATEMLACVWSTGGHSPQILKLMPPSYEPRPRTGIVGVGNPDVLRVFREVFAKEIEHIRKSYVPPSEPFGNRFSIGSAVAFVTSVLAEAIEEVKNPTVAMPVHTLTITKAGFSVFPVYARSPGNPGIWRQLTTPTDSLSILKPMPAKVREDFRRREAMQLFE